MKMNVNILKEILQNDFEIRTQFEARGLKANEVKETIRKIINKEGLIDGSESFCEQTMDTLVSIYTNEKHEKIKWRNRCINLADHIKMWSRDGTKVGAVLVSKKGGDITTGYNGFPFGVKDDPERYSDKNKQLKQDMVVHAEVNAIVAAGSRAADGHLYVVGKSICSRCAGPIIQSGIKKVFAIKPKAEGTYTPKDIPGSIDWEASGRLAVSMMEEAGIEIVFYEPNPEVEEIENLRLKYSDF